MVAKGVTLIWVGTGALRPIEDAKSYEVTSTDEAASLIDHHRSTSAVVVVAGGLELDWLGRGASDHVRPDRLHDLDAAVERARARARSMRPQVQSPELGGLAFMATAMAHEVRNALSSAILNCASLETIAKDAVVPDGSEFHETIADISEAMGNIADAINAMLSLVQPPEEDPRCDLCDALVGFATYVHKEMVRVADFETEIPDHPCHVPLSRATALEVTAVLLANAARAVETASDPAVKVRVLTDRDVVILEVSDNGVGMTADVLARATVPFFTTRPNAVGMGLSFAAMTVRRADGDIQIESEPSAGTTVRLILPRLESDGPVAERTLN